MVYGKLWRLLIIPLLLALSPQMLLAASTKDRHSIDFDTVFYETETSCVSGATGQSSLEGHVLPATKGGVGFEQYFPNPDAYGLVPPEATQAEIDYYIDMRWRAWKWDWNGNVINGSEDAQWYFNSPHRRILVTNPVNGKSIIAAAIESGPAPWAGTKEGPDNPPSYWQGYIEGTPQQYTGRVAGLAPKAMQTLGAKMRLYGEVNNDDLLFAWAPDQNATPGPTELDIGGSSNDPQCTGGLGISPDGFVFPLQTTQKRLKDHGPAWCWDSQTNCHHDYNAADIFETVGTPVVAARDGVVVAADNDACGGYSHPSARIHWNGTDAGKSGDDEWYYFTHMRPGSVKVRAGQKVVAGQQLGVIGPSQCAQGTPSHLHIDVAHIENDFPRCPHIVYDRDGNPRICDPEGDYAQAKKYLLNIQPALTESFKYLPAR